MVNLIDTNFDSLGESAFEYLKRMHTEGAEFPFRLQSGTESTFLATTFACFIANLLGREQDIPSRERIIRSFLNLKSDQDGWLDYPDLHQGDFVRTGSHDWNYLITQGTVFCRMALRCLGEEPVVPFPWVQRLVDENKVESYLDNLDWRNPWLVSNMDMFLGTFLLEWLDKEPSSDTVKNAVDTYFRWHDEHIDQVSGFWGDQTDALNAMAGGYHMILHYHYAGRYYQPKKPAIDATLALTWKDHLFVYGGGGGACEDLDGVDILIRLGRQDEWKHKEIKTLLMQVTQRILNSQNKDGGFPWRLQPDIGSSLVKSLNDPLMLRAWGFSLLYKALHRSHYNSTHYYSSFSAYPFMISHSDLWSTWFRLLTIGFIAQRYPESFKYPCNWKFPQWPGLGFDSNFSKSF